MQGIRTNEKSLEESRGKRIVMDRFIKPIFERKARYVGIELEYPVITDGNEDTRAASSGLLVHLIKQYGFTEQSRGEDELLVRVTSPEGDCISFDLYYGQIEFSMWRDHSMVDIAERFNRLFQIAADYYSHHGHILTGMGTNFQTDFMNIPFVADDFTRRIRAYMENHTYYKNSNCIFNNMFSTQTHMEVSGERLIDVFNLMNKLDFVRGLLFSNSLPDPRTLPLGKYYPEGTLCARDFNWRYSDFPATGCFDREFRSIDELAELIAGLEFFLEKKNDSVVPTNRRSINQYFSDPERPDDHFALFRMFSHTALNHYHTLEIRDDCTQPVSEAFAPSAFHVGILSNIDAAMELTFQFYHDHGVGCSNSVLREMAVTGQRIVDDEVMRFFLSRLLEIAQQGLVRRGYGEERFLRCLERRVESLSCPASVMRSQIAEGMAMDEMIRRFGLGGEMI